MLDLLGGSCVSIGSSRLPWGLLARTGLIFCAGLLGSGCVVSAEFDPGGATIDGGVRYIDGGVIDGEVAYIDGGVADGGVEVIDGGVRYIDGGVIDGGVAYIDGGVIDGGVAYIDGGVAYIDGGVAYIDGGVAYIDGGVLDGGIAYVDGGVLDGGTVYIDGGVQYIDGGVVYVDGGVQSPDGGPCGYALDAGPCPGVMTNLVAYWPMDVFTIGNTTPDIVGQHDGTFAGITPLPGRFGTSAGFAGVGAPFIDIPYSPDFYFAPAGFTVAVWVRPESFPNSGYLFGDSDLGQPDTPHRLFMSSGNVVFRIEAPNQIGGEARSSLQLSPFTWYHLVGVYDSGSTVNNIEIYVDGTLEATGSLATVIFTANLPLTIGNVTGSQNIPFDGRIDEVRVWNRPLSAPEVFMEYQR
jgi:hypothetical protein